MIRRTWAFASYDAWKLATPPEYEWLGDDPEEEGPCWTCSDRGWVSYGDRVDPCPECYEEVDPLADEWLTEMWL